MHQVVHEQQIGDLSENLGMRRQPARTSLFFCPSFILKALRATIFTARLPLRGDLRASTITFFYQPTHLRDIFFVRADGFASVCDTADQYMHP